jgi:chaperonin GroES
LSEQTAPSEVLVNVRETLNVLYDRILIKRSEPVLMTEGGLHIAETHAERPDEGYVVKVGSGRLMRDGSVRPLSVKPGDRVLFGKFSGSATEVQTPSGPLVVLREDEILAWWSIEEIPEVAQ